jgi:phosphoenolpyruvate---glycerone phosphotransferase subunit DhaM
VIGIVVVSHSPALARAAVDLALEMAGDAPPALRIAAGAAGGVTGTDAVAIAAAIDELATPEGVLVVMDLGSAVLSAGMALEFTTSGTPVVLSTAPFVEGVITAVVSAASGATLEVVDAEARRALEAKIEQLGGAVASSAANPGPAVAAAGDETASFEALIRNPSGLHARPAATFVKTVGRYGATVTVADLDAGKGPISGASLISLMSLGVAEGTRVRVEASGPGATSVIHELETLVNDGFGEL